MQKSFTVNSLKNEYNHFWDKMKLLIFDGKDVESIFKRHVLLVDYLNF